MAKIIAIANQKGGVGKTTTCVNLAASLAAMQKRILVVDSDPQGNATMASGINKFALINSICQLLIEDVDIHDCLITETNGSFHLLPANEELTAAEVRLLDFASREFKLKNALAQISDNYDYIFIDCPPSLNLLTVNAMCAANSIIVPLQCEYFALEGLTLLIDTVDQLAQAVNPTLKIEGILRTMFDNRNRLSSDVSEELKRNFGDLVYKTIIPRNVRLAEAPSFGKPAMYYDKSSVGAKAYLALAGEIVEKDLLEAKARKAAKARAAREAKAAALKAQLEQEMALAQENQMNLVDGDPAAFASEAYGVNAPAYETAQEVAQNAAQDVQDVQNATQEFEQDMTQSLETVEQGASASFVESNEPAYVESEADANADATVAVDDGANVGVEALTDSNANAEVESQENTDNAQAQIDYANANYTVDPAVVETISGDGTTVYVTANSVISTTSEPMVAQIDSSLEPAHFNQAPAYEQTANTFVAKSTDENVVASAVESVVESTLARVVASAAGDTEEPEAAQSDELEQSVSLDKLETRLEEFNSDSLDQLKTRLEAFTSDMDQDLAAENQVEQAQKAQSDAFEQAVEASDATKINAPETDSTVTEDTNQITADVADMQGNTLNTPADTTLSSSSVEYSMIQQDISSPFTSDNEASEASYATDKADSSDADADDNDSSLLSKIFARVAAEKNDK